MRILDRRHASGFSWANAHRIADDHAREVFSIFATAQALFLRALAAKRSRP